MSDTLNSMEYIYADILSADQLMEDDLIEYVDEDNNSSIVEVVDIVSLKNSYLIIAKNEFSETIEFELAEDTKVKLYVLQ